MSGRLSFRAALVITGGLLLLYGLGDALILLRGDWPHLCGVVGVPLQKWEEIVVYAPFAKAFSLRQPLPMAPGVAPDLGGLTVYPWLTVLASGLLFKGLAGSSLDVYLLLCHAVLPVVAFWLLYAIFRQYIFKSWAVLLSFLGVAYFSGFHYLSRLKILLATSWDWGTLFRYGAPEIARTPFPSIALPLLLVPLLLTVSTRRADASRIGLLGFMWSLQVYVYAFNFLAGVPFFCLWIVYIHWRTERRLRLGRALLSLLGFAGTCLIMIVPWYAAYDSPIGRELSSKLFAPPGGANVGSDWGILAGYILPLGLLVVSFAVFRADYAELAYRYAPVFIAMVVDLMLGVMTIVRPGLDAALYYHRISNIVFRFFFFVPFLYFLSLPEKRVSSAYGLTPARDRIAGLLHKYVHEYRLVYAVVGSLAMAAYLLCNAVRFAATYNHEASARMRAVEMKVTATCAVLGEGRGAIVYEDIAPNLMDPAVRGIPSLLAPVFGNWVTEAEILDRLVLYGKLRGWSEDDFVAFMAPNESLRALSSYQGGVDLVTDDLLRMGLGYWLLNHRRVMSAAELASYLQRTRSRFREGDLSALLNAYPVRAAVFDGGVPVSLQSFPARKADGLTIVVLERAGREAL